MASVSGLRLVCLLVSVHVEFEEGDLLGSLVVCIVVVILVQLWCGDLGTRKIEEVIELIIWCDIC